SFNACSFSIAREHYSKLGGRIAKEPAGGRAGGASYFTIHSPDAAPPTSRNRQHDDPGIRYEWRAKTFGECMIRYNLASLEVQKRVKDFFFPQSLQGMLLPATPTFINF